MNRCAGAPSIISIATHVPRNRVMTEDLFKAFEGRISPVLRDTLERLRVDRRFSIVEDYTGWVSGEGSLQLGESTAELALQAAKKCLERGNCDPSQIGLFIAATNTPDNHLPATAYEIISGLGDGFPHDVNVANMASQGCSVLIKAFDIAHDYLSLHRNKKVLIVAAETHTGFALAKGDFYYGLSELGDKSAEEAEATQRIIQIFLFGDGAIALLLGNDENGARIGPFKHHTNLMGGDKELLTITQGRVLTPQNFYIPYYHMNKDVPRRGAFYAEKCVFDLLAEASLEKSAAQSFESYFIHTGSWKILNGVCQLFGLPSNSAEASSSYKILNQYANVSSCSIGFIMHDHFKNNSSPGRSLMVSFGAGFSGSAAILDYSKGKTPILS